MKALLYLMRKTFKNTLKELIHHPAKLILSLVVLALLAFVIGVSFLEPPMAADLRDIHELFAMVFALYLVIFIMGAWQGLSSGASFYTMADVNLLFNSPISPKRVLVYGLVKQIGASLLIGFFLLFQYAWLNESYGITIPDMLTILVGYALVFFCSRLTAMAIYSFSSGSETRRRVIRFVLIGGTALISAGAAVPALLGGSGDMLGSLVASANAVWIDFVPVAGWMSAAARGVMTGAALPALLGLAGGILFIVLFLVIILRMRSDFYEDVLQATEKSFSAITAQKEGKVQDALPAKVKVGKTGLNGGFGPMAFFYKHRLENRRARLFILDTASLVMALTSIAFAFFMRDAGGLLTAFIFATYMQIFSSATGRWLREVTMPYVYMVPASPFAKLIAICCENFLKIIVDALVIFIPIGLLLQSSPLDIAACILARIGFGLLFMAGNILSERLLGSVDSKILVMFIYLLMLIVLAAPGVTAGILIGVFLPFSEALVFPIALICTMFWNVLCSLLVFFLCRNILNYAELNQR
ncbi:MAG: hypothetical protein HFE85_05230 [Clostridiales bacterium]|nr:hypothetical protein [Clostridiales bacterium]